MIDYCSWVSVCVPFSLSEIVIRNTGNLCTLRHYVLYLVEQRYCYRPGCISYLIPHYSKSSCHVLFSIAVLT